MDVQHALSMLRNQLRPLQAYLDDESVQEIMINARDDIWIERRGSMFRVEEVLPETNLLSAIKAIASINSKGASKIMDARLPGIRVAAVQDPIAVKGNAMCIRKHTQLKVTLDSYLESGALEVLGPEQVVEKFARPDGELVLKGGVGVVEFLRWAVASHKNILVSGATSSGKTTLLNALIAEIARPDVSREDRILTIEDTAELKVDSPNHIGLEANAEHEVTIRNLVRLALRMRPDRIVVGEIRGAEAYDLLDALNTGHSGGFCTMHADSALMALTRLESMVRMHPDAANLPLEALRSQIASTFRFVVHAARRKGQRGPDEIIELLGVQDGEYLSRTVFSRVGVN
jgi:pilus assembly protein CpaF